MLAVCISNTPLSDWLGRRARVPRVARRGQAGAPSDQERARQRARGVARRQRARLVGALILHPFRKSAIATSCSVGEEALTKGGVGAEDRAHAHQAETATALYKCCEISFEICD